MYVGASSDENEKGFSVKVMTERDRLQQVLQRHHNKRQAVPQESVVKVLASAN